MNKIKEKNVPVIILCGGKGTRFFEETRFKPKPMTIIAGIPILLHIILIYKKFNYKKFILACGYKHDYILNFFKKKLKKKNNFKLTKGRNCYKFQTKNFEILIINTGLNTLTGERILKCKKYIDTNIFLATYGDAVSDINLKNLKNTFIKKNCDAMVTAVKPPARFGKLNIDQFERVKNLEEKKDKNTSWINGGFFIFKKKFFKYLRKGEMLERGPLQRVAKMKKLYAYKHLGFWQCIDTLREKLILNKIIKKKKPSWLNIKLY